MTTTFEKKLLEKERQLIQECYLVGRLADDNPSLPKGLAVSAADHYEGANYSIHIQPLSTEPLLLAEKLGKTKQDTYVGFDTKIQRYLETTGYFAAEDKEAFLNEHFHGKLVLFKPLLTPDRKNGGYHYNFEISLVEEGDTSSDQYVPVPAMRKGMTAGMFEKELIEQKPLTLASYNHSLDIPEFIICDKYLYHIPDSDVINKYPARDNLYKCRKPEDIRRMELPENYQFATRVMHKEISFISESKRLEWIDLIHEYGESIIPKEKEEPVKQSASVKMKTMEKTEIIKVEEGLISENQFMNRLDYLAKKRQLVYVEDDLYNFHTSLKTSNFSILGGMSGTGKTELALLYAESLGLEKNKNLLVIPVSPSFTEPSDVLGFLNQQTGVYLESEVGLVSFLHRAAQNPNIIHMCLFDEMNLGQVEHYFSDFISLLEMPKEKRVLRLFGEKCHCIQQEYKNGIPIGDNVLFVGTANFDETTKDFSNRMLDRSNVILLEKMNFMEAKKIESEKVDSVHEYEVQEMNEVGDLDKIINTDNFYQWIKPRRGLSALEDHELEILDEIHDEMSSFDSQTGVSFRITKAIGHYLDNIPTDEKGNHFISREAAFDYQVKQRILTKIRGYRDQIESLVGRYEDKVDGRIGMILTVEKGFEKSRELLEQKAKELMRNGYTL